MSGTIKPSFLVAGRLLFCLQSISSHGIIVWPDRHRPPPLFVTVTLVAFFFLKVCWLSFDSVLREHTISGLDTFRLLLPTTPCCLHHCLLLTPQQLPPSLLTRNTASCCLALFYFLFIFIFCLMIWSQHFMADHVDSICSNTVRNVIKNYSDFRQFLKSLEYCFYWIIED